MRTAMNKMNFDVEDNARQPQRPSGGLLVAAEVLDEAGNTKSIQFVEAELLIDPMVGRRLRFFREQQGLSPLALVEQSNGFSVEDVHLAEANPGNTPIGKLAAICSALGKTMYDLSESDSCVH
jgi:hypothetical protein